MLFGPFVFVIAALSQIMPSETLMAQYAPVLFVGALASHVTGMRTLGKAPLLLEGIWLATNVFSLLGLFMPWITPLIFGEQ